MVGLQTVDIKKGQFIFGRKKAAQQLNMKESTVWKHIKFLEKIDSISLKSNNKFTVVSVVGWAIYQGDITTKEQQSNNKGTTEEQQSNTDKNVKNVENVKNVKNKDIVGQESPDNVPYKEIVDYLNLKAGTNFRPSASKTKTLIKARINESYSIDDFKKVIDIKSDEWLKNKDMVRYLRPETLFGTKFESYLNQKQVYKDTNERATSEYDNFF
ncbi:phage conserved hypothetical protein [Carnobacterium sp. 17-4]|nr:phage conserved hypothetical protein [Carnobacterium sp. 17-4]